MRVLLDTCTFLWLCLDAPELSSVARHLFLTADAVYLSPASAWEISVKYKLGKLALPQTPGQWVTPQRLAHGIDTLPISESATLALNRLPDLHKDPFDRLLMAQALHEGLVLLTPDPLIRDYPVRTEW